MHILALVKSLDEYGEEVGTSRVSRRYNICRRTVRDWNEKVSRGETLHDKGGRPSVLDETSENELIDTIQERKKQKSCISDHELNDLMQAHADLTSMRRNQLFHDICDDTKKRLKKKLKIKKVKPQVVSLARFEACSDVRMSYSMWIMAKALTDGLPGQVIWNWDATQFNIGFDGKGKMVCIMEKSDDKSPASVTQEVSLNFAIKWMHMANANGETIPLVLLIAVPDMDKEEFESYSIPGLTYNTIPGHIGYLAFCSSRSGNAKFFTWFLEEIAIKAIVSCRTHHNCVVRSCFRSFVTVFLCFLGRG